MRMKLQEISFKRPVKLVQVFRHVHRYDKSEKSFEDRKEDLAWRPISSKNGHVKEGVLFLPEEVLQDPKLTHCDLITVEDDLQEPSLWYGDQGYTYHAALRVPRQEGPMRPDFHHCFHLHHPNRLDIFEIRQNEDLELFLRYGYYAVGVPERPNFKLCELKKGSAVEIKINGKTDFSLTSRRGRQFKEQHYIFHYVGDFTHCRILKEPYAPFVKEMPADRKVVDLLKPLW